MSRPGAAAQQAREREVIHELAQAVRAGAPGTLDPMFAAAFAAAADDAGPAAGGGRPDRLADRYLGHLLA